jgi:hypothetical protein
MAWIQWLACRRLVAACIRDEGCERRGAGDVSRVLMNVKRKTVVCTDITPTSQLFEPVCVAFASIFSF